MLIVGLLGVAVNASTGVGPVVVAAMVAGVSMSVKNGHLAVWFIQLEIISILSLYALLGDSSYGGPPPFSALIAFTALASEGAAGLALIVSCSRVSRGEILKAHY